MNKDLSIGVIILGLCLLLCSFFIAQSLEYQKHFERFIKSKGWKKKKLN